METIDNQDVLIQGLCYLVRVSEVPDTEIFKICLEYWSTFTKELYDSEIEQKAAARKGLGVAGGLQLGGMNPVLRSRKDLYRHVLTGVRNCMISKMAKPEEVLIVEDENGDVVCETMKDIDVIVQYKTMKDTLVYLTHLNCDDTENIMLEKLHHQVSERREQNDTFL